MKFFFGVIAILYLASCSRNEKLNFANDSFLSVYQDNVKLINSKRNVNKKNHHYTITNNPIDVSNKVFISRYYKEVEEINNRRNMINSPKIYYSTPPTKKKEKLKSFKNSNIPLDSDLFKVVYYQFNYPDYYNLPTSFENIVIPDNDIREFKFGTIDKDYILIDNRYLQKNIDYIKSMSSFEDNEKTISIIEKRKKHKKAINSIESSISTKDDTQNTMSEEDLENKIDKLLKRNPECYFNNYCNLVDKIFSSEEDEV